MDILNEILIKSYLVKTISKIDFSLNEIKEKHPTRLDLIESMQSSLSELIEVNELQKELIEENRILKLMLGQEKMLNMGLKIENNELTKKVENLIEKL